MSEDSLDSIRGRAARWKRTRVTNASRASHDRALLLAEIDRLAQVLAADRARIAAAIRDVVTKSDWPERPHHLLPRLLRVVEGGDGGVEEVGAGKRSMSIRCECDKTACDGEQCRKRQRVKHWGGGIRHARGTRLPGWACCCTGDRCERISADEDAMTRNPHLVTCKACLRWMAKDKDRDRWGIFESERGPAKDATGCDV